MKGADDIRTADEVARLSQALEAETQRCVQLQRRLDRAGAEFEQFVSLSAHDLRESLRQVAAYSQLLAEEYARELDSDAGRYLGRIREGTTRMQSLLSDMVAYGETGTGELQSARTDMEAVLCQALLGIDKRLTEQGAVVTHDPLPPVSGDFDALTKVLEHLIANAIKYCGKPAPQVHISAKRLDADWVFSVRDEGPGVDPAAQGHIFEVFTRLHGEEHPGHGLGLAFCRKAIEWQGGRIWLESSLGSGSTFFFTLPPAD